MQFIEDFLNSKKSYFDTTGEAETLNKILSAASAINECFKSLLAGNLWLSSSEATQIGRCGRTFVCQYATLAHHLFLKNRLRYPVHSKLHMLDHTFRRLLNASGRCAFCLHPLSEATMMDEESPKCLAQTFLAVCYKKKPSILSFFQVPLAESWNLVAPPCFLNAGLYWPCGPTFTTDITNDYFLRTYQRYLRKTLRIWNGSWYYFAPPSTKWWSLGCRAVEITLMQEQSWAKTSCWRDQQHNDSRKSFQYVLKTIKPYIWPYLVIYRFGRMVRKNGT